MSKFDPKSPKGSVPNQWQIQDFPQGGAPTSKIAIIFQIFAENCMKMKEFGPWGEACIPGAPLGSANANVQSKFLTRDAIRWLTALFTKPPDSLPPYRMGSGGRSVRWFPIDIFPFYRERLVTKQPAAL